MVEQRHGFWLGLVEDRQEEMLGSGGLASAGGEKVSRLLGLREEVAGPAAAIGRVVDVAEERAATGWRERIRDGATCGGERGEQVDRPSALTGCARDAKRPDEDLVVGAVGMVAHAFSIALVCAGRRSSWRQLGRAAPMGVGQVARFSILTVAPVWGASTISPEPM